MPSDARFLRRAPRADPIADCASHDPNAIIGVHRFDESDALVIKLARRRNAAGVA